MADAQSINRAVSCCRCASCIPSFLLCGGFSLIGSIIHGMSCCLGHCVCCGVGCKTYGQVNESNGSYYWMMACTNCMEGLTSLYTDVCWNQANQIDQTNIANMVHSIKWVACCPCMCGLNFCEYESVKTCTYCMCPCCVTKLNRVNAIQTPPDIQQRNVHVHITRAQGHSHMQFGISSSSSYPPPPPAHTM